MEDAIDLTTRASGSNPTERLATALLELLYPVHYRTNMALERAMRGELSRKQAAILWLIHSAGIDAENVSGVNNVSSSDLPKAGGRVAEAAFQRARPTQPGGRSMRRKEIVARLQDWFDVSSPAITQALRRMTRPPLGVVRLVEDAYSAREKRVVLTPRGEEVIRGMVERGREHLRRLLKRIPQERIGGGIEFLRAAVAAMEQIHSTPHGK
jgi:DNA-binding MarR family transcriptional regulator